MFLQVFLYIGKEWANKIHTYKHTKGKCVALKTVINWKLNETVRARVSASFMKVNEMMVKRFFYWNRSAKMLSWLCMLQLLGYVLVRIECTSKKAENQNGIYENLVKYVCECNCRCVFKKFDRNNNSDSINLESRPFFCILSNN